MKFNAMFQPIEIGPMTVKNRFVVPPMGNNFANTDGTMSEQSAAYYKERAKGGFGLITGQMIGRWGNFFNREAFGEYTNGLFAMRLPVDAVRSSDITIKMWNHAETVKGVMYIQVHPTYLYESMWCLMVLIIMLLYRKHKKFDGEVFLIYLLGYGLGRFWIESLRTDQLLLPKVGLPVSQLLAGTIVIVSAILVITGRKKAARIKSTESNQ